MAVASSTVERLDTAWISSHQGTSQSRSTPIPRPRTVTPSRAACSRRAGAELASAPSRWPFDPDRAGPRDRLLDDYELTALVADPPLPGDRRAIALADCARPAPAPRAAPFRYRPDEPYTVKFSSGSTSQPKAVDARARHFDHMATEVERMFALGPADVLLVVAPLTVWLQRFMVHLAILGGASISLARPEQAVDALRRERPTVVVAVPRLLAAVEAVHARRAGGADPEPLSATWGGRIRCVWTGSAPIGRPLLEAYERGGVPVYEGYGMTETGLIAKNHPGCRRIGSAGKPFPGVQVAIDASGQIRVQSGYLPSERYWRGEDPGRFLGGGWVATGDLGHFDADGFLYVDGRADELIVLESGHKVRPFAVEESLRRDPAVADCAVFGHGRPHLVAAIVQAGERRDDGALEVALAAHNAARPAAERVLGFVRVEPFTASGLVGANGKLLRRALEADLAPAIDALYRGARG